MKKKKENLKSMNKQLIGGIACGVAIIGGIVLGFMSTTTIDPGYVGVVYSLNGGIQDEVLTQGLQFKAPWHKVCQYSVATEQGYLSADSKEGSEGDDSFGIPTSDGKLVNVDLEYSYHFDLDKVPETFTMFKGQSGKYIEETFMRGKLKTWAGEVSSKFSILDIYGEQRTNLNAQVYEHVKNKFSEYGIVIDSISFSRIGLDSQTEQAIQERVNAQQALEKEKVETQKAKQVAERKKIEAQGEAEAALIATKGQAERKEVLAKADALTNKLISQSLTPELLQKMEMEARLAHGWVEIQGAGSTIVNKK